MIGYITLGTNNIEKLASFYDALLEKLGAGRVMQAEDYIVWGNDKGGAWFSIHVPNDGKKATVGNGVMIALRAENMDAVTNFHDYALELGATDEGAPGMRGESFFAAYFRDPEGNKLNVHCMVS